MHNLNLAQKNAVETTEGPVLIVAGAGTGKTRVITQRILNIIKSGIAPHNILAITFTNKAATEMRERVHHLMNEDRDINIPISLAERPFISTFHSLGVHIIRENANLLNLTRNFTIFDRSDSKKAVKDALEQCSLDPKQFDPNTILNMISRAKGDGVNYIHYRDHAKSYMEEIVSQVWEKYDAKVASEKALDFDDLLLKTANLLEKHSELRKRYSEIWKYIHVDEYQDTNRVQYKIVRLLTDFHHNLCVVGDADQNIYSWRGATIENILNFEKDYPEATVITLEENYRSTKTILTAANNVIEKNRMRKKKTLFTGNDHGDKINLSVNYTEVDEARHIAESARNLVENGTNPREIAVLYRTNFQSRVIEEAFIKKNIPYQMVGTRFFERKEIKDVLSYIKASLNRESWSDIGRIINVPVRGIGKATIAKIMSQSETSLPDAMKIKVNNFWHLLDDIAREAKEKKTSELVKFVIQETGIEKSLRDGTSEGEERLLNVRELVNVATQYDHLPSTEGVESFLTNSALASDQDDLTKNEEAVKLMTVHASKGLEFEYVFIAGMEQDLFPFKHMGKEKIDNNEEEEERRLFYVALTRAKKKVFLSYTIIRSVYGAQKVNTPSEFIEDIEKNLIEEAVPDKPSGAKALFIDF